MNWLPGKIADEMKGIGMGLLEKLVRSGYLSPAIPSLQTKHVLETVLFNVEVKLVRLVNLVRLLD